MEYIMEHFGKAILVGVALLALGALVVLAVKNGYVSTEFENAFRNFFSNMNALS